MKPLQQHTPLRAALGLSTAAMLLTLAACGGGGNGAAAVATTASPSLTGSTTAAPTASAVSTPTVRVSGRVMNVGYLGNTQVCVDTNGDGLCSADEPSTTSSTDGQGRYTLDVPTGHRGSNLLAVVRPGSTDSAATTAAPITIQQGWTLAALLEYDDNASIATANISPISATYYARQRVQGRNRLSNQIAMFTRIVLEPNIDASTGALLLPVDFDYVANPRNTLAARLKSLSDVLSARANTAAAPLGMLGTSAVLYSWYSTYVAPTAAAAGVPVDASKIAAFADTSTSSAAYFLANDYHYFRPQSQTALRLRDGLTETAGWLRKTGAGLIDTFDRRATTLASGTVTQKLARWAAGVWGEISADEGDYLTLNTRGAAAFNSGTDYLQPRTISFADGNRVTFRNANSGSRWALEVSDSPGTNFFIEEWLGEQRSYANYYNGTAPTVAPLTTKPACSTPYPGYPQANTTNATTASTWFTVCFDYYVAEYYDKVAGDINLKGSDPSLPGANFYDVWFKDAMLVAPLTQSCGTTTTPLAKVTVLGKSHCNWAVDAAAGHSLADLFATGGVALNSWTKVYGNTSFTTGGVTTVRTAGTAAQAGLPQQLKLSLQRSGNQTSGTGSLTSDDGAWTATSFGPTTEAVAWQISPENPNMVLISWPFRDINDPRVKTNTTSAGATAAAAPLLPAGHFTAVFNGNTFSVAPSTHTAPNVRKLAVLLQDGVFVTGQYYGAGFTYNERYFTIPAMERGITVLNYVFGKLYAAGFTDVAR